MRSLELLLGNTMGFVAPMIVGIIINDNNDVQHWQVDLSINDEQSWHDYEM